MTSAKNQEAINRQLSALPVSHVDLSSQSQDPSICHHVENRQQRLAESQPRPIPQVQVSDPVIEFHRPNSRNQPHTFTSSPAPLDGPIIAFLHHHHPPHVNKSHQRIHLPFYRSQTLLPSFFATSSQQSRHSLSRGHPHAKSSTPKSGEKEPFVTEEVPLSSSYCIRTPSHILHLLFSRPESQMLIRSSSTEMPLFKVDWRTKL